ncbi:MAG: TetR/AcrR family transcriptional regulator [Actinomycetaceae bacterium]|nr:TetR/AcrR family transcriptional regulator [Actinomycetaceae bacterium]
MARPPKDMKNNARTRIENAFWELLKQTEDYNKLTINALAKQARVNHNTFYYHFSNIEELAQILCDRLVNKAPVESMYQLALESKLDITNFLEINPYFFEIVEHASLIVRSGTPQLTNHIRKGIAQRWMNTILDNTHTLPEHTMQDIRTLITFLTGGFLSVLSNSPNNISDIESLPRVLNMGIAHSIIDTLIKLTQPHSTKE